MPQRIFCSKCGTTLYEGYEVIEPANILLQYGSICPCCGKRMALDLRKIKIALIKVS